MLLEGAGGGAVQRVQSYALHVDGPGGARVERVTRARVRVGSHPGAEVVLADDAVSRLHFELCAEPGGFRLRDLGSTNGTFVDGLRVFDVLLARPATIVAGRTELRFTPLPDVETTVLAPRSAFGPLVGASPPMLALYQRIERVAATDATVLVEGESGTGKELVASAIHDASPRRSGPFVVFDCSAVPGGLLESELFGHERGAFTGATGRREGSFFEADGGTLFLDEIGELPLELQPKLLRALERREARPVGADRARPVDVRFVAATNRDLAREVNRGTFREDLYHRLAVVELELPPLRERTGDLPLLVRSIVGRLLQRDPARRDQLLASFTPAVWAELERRPWRGNVRELRNLLERAVALGEGPAELGGPRPEARLAEGEVAKGTAVGPGVEGPAGEGGGARRPDLARGFLEQRRALVEGFERTYLRAMLEAHGGNYSRAAEAAGLDRMYFKRLLKKYE